MIKQFGCVLLLAATALPVLAQTVDEQLLAAQMAYQQANNLQEQAQARLTQAQASKQQADQRLADAQMAAQRAVEELSAATAAQSAASEQLQQQTRQLKEAWQRKEGGG